jgi:2-polyprenyl-6-methoxyphenol hydroxylase-like FAD-dependent oxidoreductase
METTIPDIAVLVVGAGPTGLLLAAELCRRSVPCILIDARSEAMHWDRATVVHPRSLQIFEAIGVVDKLLNVGCKQRVIKVYSDGTMLGAIDLSTSGSAYGFNLGLSEEVTESILTDYLHRQGGLVTRGSRLVGFRPHADGVIASIDNDGKEYELTARWVVGCDGIHSATRVQTGIDFEGHKYVKEWAVFDTHVEGWNDTHEGIFAYQDILPIILTALPNKRWRVYVRPSSKDSDLVAEATSTLRMYTPSASFVNVENATRFNCYTKIAARFRSGPAFLAGDSAHLCSPSEGHGMNTGIQDAFNLAWKLALVYQGAANERLLDTYETERRPIAEAITRSGDESEESQLMTDRVERERRNQAIRAVLSDPEELHSHVLAETELVIDYTGSPIIMGDASDFLSAGFRLPDNIAVEQPEARGWRYLHQLAHRPGHTLLLLAGAEANEAELIGLHSAIRDLAAHSSIFESAFTVAAYTGLSGEIGVCSPSAAGQLGIHGITLLAMRPDGYIGARADRNHLAAIESYRNLIFAGSGKVAETPVAAEQARR